MKLEKMLLTKPVSDHFSGNSREFSTVLEKFENQQKTLGK